MTDVTQRKAFGARRLVLGFDAGCMTCSDLASKIEAKVGDKLEVRSLHDPQVKQWRGLALGEDAPWAPTLFEVGGTREVRAWTGTGMAVRLMRALGPISTWRLMQVFGEGGKRKVEVVAAAGGSPIAEAASAAVSRGQFLKGAGGAALAFGLLGMASPAQAAYKDGIDVEGLTEALSAIEELPDSVIRKGEDAAKAWLRRRLNIDYQAGDPQPRGVLGCISAVGIAIVGNALPYFKLLKIRQAIRAAGGVRIFVRAFLGAYRYLRSVGYTRYGAIKGAIARAARASSRSTRQALLELFYLGSVADACFG